MYLQILCSDKRFFENIFSELILGSYTSSPLIWLELSRNFSNIPYNSQLVLIILPMQACIPENNSIIPPIVNCKISSRARFKTKWRCGTDMQNRLGDKTWIGYGNKIHNRCGDKMRNNYTGCPKKTEPACIRFAKTKI